MKSLISFEKQKQIASILNQNSNKISFLIDYFNFKALKTETETRPVKFIIAPKIIQKKTLETFDLFQKEFSLFMFHCIKNFPVVVKYLKEYNGNDSFISKLLDLNERADKYKEENYNDWVDTNAAILRNDFMYDDEQSEIYQIEVNFHSISMFHFAGNLQKMLRLLFTDFNGHKLFESNCLRICLRCQFLAST